MNEENKENVIETNSEEINNSLDLPNSENKELSNKGCNQKYKNVLKSILRGLKNFLLDILKIFLKILKIIGYAFFYMLSGVAVFLSTIFIGIFSVAFGILFYLFIFGGIIFLIVFLLTHL